MKPFLRIAAITLWTLAALGGLALIANLGGQLLDWTQDRYQWPLTAANSDWILAILNYGPAVGTVVITPAAVILGMRGKLPGTRKTPRNKLRGFQVVPFSEDE